MTDESANPGRPTASAPSAPGMPLVADRATFQAELDRLRVREKPHTREGDAIAAARRRPGTGGGASTLPGAEFQASAVPARWRALGEAAGLATGGSTRRR